MNKITDHPIIDVTPTEVVTFIYEGHTISGHKGFTIAAALHQAGFPIHSHSLKNRERSLECGIGKCGACEMLVDGEIKRICITKVDGVIEVGEIPKDYHPHSKASVASDTINIYKTKVLIVGAGPAGLATREILNKHDIPNLVVDNNDDIGGQFLMQTHQFFFFEKKKKFGGMRGFDIAQTLAGDDRSGIMLDATVWDILQGGRVAMKNIITGEVYYIDADYLVVATGAVPFMPTFGNDDLPGVYTAAVIQKMMNIEHTLLGKNILTVGAGNIGYLTSYQLIQSGANIKCIIEAMDHEGGFPVQANRIRRLGVPIMLSHILIEAIPNADNSGITGAVVAECKDFKAVPGTEKIIDGIDAINICTGLVSDDQLLTKGFEIFGRNCYGAGDAVKIGEGTSAVLKGQQVAYEIIDALDGSYDYNRFLELSKEYIDSQQHPIKILEKPALPDTERMFEKPFVVIDCLYGFACNPCEFACPHGAIVKTSTSSVPEMDYSKCTGCMACVYQCPGLAIFGYNLKKDTLFLPIELDVTPPYEVFLVDNHGNKLGTGTVEKRMTKANKTHILRVKSETLHGEELLSVRGAIPVDEYPEPVKLKKLKKETLDDSETYICHCDDVKLDEILEVIGDRKFISVDEIKHTTRLGMGACRGKRCIKRLKQTIKSRGITVVGEPTPRGPLSNQVEMGKLYPDHKKEKVFSFFKKATEEPIKVQSFVAGGGIGGSALFRYLAEAEMAPVMINYGRGSSWRNIAGGRTSFSLPELAEIATYNHTIFKDLQDKKNIDYRAINYVTFAHDEAMYRQLEESMKWSRATMIDPSEFRKYISPYMNPNLKKYMAALITEECWQATPGKVIDLIRRIGIDNGGTVLEDCELLDLTKDGSTYKMLVMNKLENRVYEYHSEVFINALGAQAGKFAAKLDIDAGFYPVKHQAFITRRLPFMGVDNSPLPMIIDRRQYKGFSAVYGQQLVDTGQIIGCASPLIEALETNKNMKVNSKEFVEIISEIFVDWIPDLAAVGYQAVWSGYYVEPKMIIDTDHGIFAGLRGQGFMLGQHLAKLYVDKLKGDVIPQYFSRLALNGDGLLEKAFK